VDTTATELADFLLAYQPFASLDPDAVASMAAAARVERFQAGELILDAFRDPNSEMFVVVDGQVDLWNERDRILELPNERLRAGAVFGFSSMLTERSVGPRAVAAGPTTVAAIPAAVVGPALTSPEGAKFLAEHVSSAIARGTQHPTYSLIDDLISHQPLVVEASSSAYEVARQMTEAGRGYAVVGRGEGTYAVVSDAALRRELIVAGRAATTPVGDLLDEPAPAVHLGDSATEALILLLESEQDFLVVTDAAGRLCGVVAPRDFAVSPTTAGVSLHEQLRRAPDIEELVARGRRVLSTLDHLLAGGLTPDRVISIYSTMIDALIRRAITLVFEEHPGLSLDAFAWLSLGSNGRREAVPSSDADTAVAFADDLPEPEHDRYRRAFGEVHAVLSKAGLSGDHHGATAAHAPFSRTSKAWRAAALDWMSDPGKNKGAVMASLLVDGRAIFGDPALLGVAQVFTDLRRHPGTMRLLLQESLARRAKRNTMLDTLRGRDDSFDIKRRAILPVVNLARWSASSVGSSALSTVTRLEDAAGSAMLPATRAANLVEAFQVLQRLRLRYQLNQLRHGIRPTDLMVLDDLSPIDRSLVQQSVREVAAAQRRMDNVSQYVPIESWTAPEDG